MPTDQSSIGPLPRPLARTVLRTQHGKTRSVGPFAAPDGDRKVAGADATYRRACRHSLDVEVIARHQQQTVGVTCIVGSVLNQRNTTDQVLGERCLMARRDFFGTATVNFGS